MIEAARSPQGRSIAEAIVQGASRLARHVWLPVPLLLCSVLLVWAADPTGTYDSLRLFTLLNFLSYTFVAVAVAAIIGETFLQQERPCLLIFGCGVLLWGCSGVMITLGFAFENRFPLDFNTMVTYHNCCVWASSFCHLAGVTISGKWQVRLKKPRLVLLVAYLCALLAGAGLLAATLYGALPVFFVPGSGGTVVRNFVLGSTIAMYALTAALLVCQRRPVWACVRWYACALLLMAVGLLAILIQKTHGGWLGWLGRGTLYLGSAYLLVAAILFKDQPLTEGMSLSEAVNEMGQKRRFSFTLAASVVFLAAAVRLLFLQALGGNFPFATFYPAVLLAAGYGGLGPGLLATAFSVLMAEWVSAALGGLDTSEPRDVIRIASFVTIGITASLVGKAMHQLQRRAILAETEARFASERALAAERLHDVEAELQRTEGWFRTVINTANEGAWIVDNNRITTYVNDRMAQILGVEQDQIVGRSLEEFIYPDDLPLLRSEMGRRREGISSKYVLRVPAEDGGARWLQISGSPLYDEDRCYCGAFAMCSDITDRKRMEDELHELASELERRVDERSAELQRLNRELESFCYSISHELRAPIARLSAFSGLIREALDEQRLAELPHLSERIDVASLKLRTVIDTLLLMNRLSRAKVERTLVDLSELAARTVAELREEYPDREIEIHVERGLRVWGDRGMLGICLRNLFHNAFKYTGKTERPSITFSRQEHPEPAFYIRDNGAGFDMSFSDKLFEPFSRLHNDSEFEGSGTGLTTVHRIVERHGGRIWAEGEPGWGATFFFTLGDSTPATISTSCRRKHEEPVDTAGRG